jgi:ribosomal protein S18 acetylase RimI-like enzyme
MEFKIKKADRNDVEEIIKLNQELFNYEFNSGFDNSLDLNWTKNNKKYFEKSITDKNSLVLVCIYNEEVVGYLIGRIENPEDYRKIKSIAEVDNMFILEEFRKKGVGKKLVEGFVKWAKKKDVEKIRVVASSKNKKAIEFYKKFGFVGYNLTLEKDL